LELKKQLIIKQEKSVNTPVISEDGQGKTHSELMELFVTQMEKRFGSFMVNGMKLFSFETKKLKKRESFGD